MSQAFAFPCGCSCAEMIKLLARKGHVLQMLSFFSPSAGNCYEVRCDTAWVNDDSSSQDLDRTNACFDENKSVRTFSKFLGMVASASMISLKSTARPLLLC